jgi:S1-C subfamily serine protease
MICQNCKRTAVAGAFFCDHCGKPLDKSPHQAAFKNITPSNQPDQNKVYNMVSKCTLTIGRKKSSDIYINHKTVSRNHAILKLDSNNTWRLEDSNSSNGTYIDDHKIRCIHLHPGSSVRFGEFTMLSDDLLSKAAQKAAQSSRHVAAMRTFYQKAQQILGAQQVAIISGLIAIVVSIALIVLFRVPSLPLDTTKTQQSNVRQQGRPLEQSAPSGNHWERDRINATVESATVLVMTKEGLGSGFFIANNLVMTNRHVVEKTRGKIYVINKALQKPMEAKIIAKSKNKYEDFAVLRTQQTHITPLSFSLDVKRAEKVSAWGYPGFLVTTDPRVNDWRQGKLTPPEVIYSPGEVKVVHDTDPKMVIHTAIIAEGNSGGPLVNEHGAVVGINTYIQIDKYSNSQVGRALASPDIVYFLRQNDINSNIK